MDISKSFKQNLYVELEKETLNVFEDLLPVYFGSFSLEKTKCTRAALKTGINTVQAFYTSNYNDENWIVGVVYSIGKAIVISLYQTHVNKTSSIKEIVVQEFEEVEAIILDLERYYIKKETNQSL